MRMRTIVILAHFKGTNNNTNGKRYYLPLNVKWPIFQHRQFYFIIGPNVLAHCLPFTRTVSFGMRGPGGRRLHVCKQPINVHALIPICVLRWRARHTNRCWFIFRMAAQNYLCERWYITCIWFQVVITEIFTWLNYSSPPNDKFKPKHIHIDKHFLISCVFSSAFACLRKFN